MRRDQVLPDDGRASVAGACAIIAGAAIVPVKRVPMNGTPTDDQHRWATARRLLEDDAIVPQDLLPASSYSPSPTRSAMAIDPGRPVTPAPAS